MGRAYPKRTIGHGRGKPEFLNGRWVDFRSVIRQSMDGSRIFVTRAYESAIAC